MSALTPYDNLPPHERLPEIDRETFAGIYNRYWQFLLGMAYSRLQNWQAAEDVVHDVFAGLWNNRQQLASVRCLKSYLATAVKYCILKEIRKAALLRKYRQSENPEAEIVLATDTAYDNKRILQLLQQEVETLPEKCRLVYQCSREQGMSIKQISEQLDIAPSTVENQLNKALKRLRGTLQKYATFFSFTFFIW